MVAAVVAMVVAVQADQATVILVILTVLVSGALVCVLLKDMDQIVLLSQVEGAALVVVVQVIMAVQADHQATVPLVLVTLVRIVLLSQVEGVALVGLAQTMGKDHTDKCFWTRTGNNWFDPRRRIR